MAQRLLIVDSDRRFIQDHQAALEASFEVDILNATEGALARLEGGQYAAVLLCVEVSENKGYSLCSAIRKNPKTQGLKVALISAKATQEEYARHQSLKGRADVYLHKPMTSSALIAALSPLVPLRAEDPDNPLGDLLDGEGPDEWLESLKTELDLDVPVRKAAPLPEPPQEALPLAHQATQKLTVIPKDAGKVELLESRVRDLEGKLVAKAEALEAALGELTDLRLRHDSVTRNLDDMEQLQASSEQAHQTLEALQAGQSDLEANLAQAEAREAGLMNELMGLQADCQRQTEAAEAAEADRQRLAEAAEAAEADRQRLAEAAQAAEADRQRLAEAAQAAEADCQRLAEAAQAAEADRQRLAEAAEAAEADRQQQAEELAAARADLQRLTEELEATRADLTNQAQMAMDNMESNLLLQAQMEEAREEAVQHLQTERSLQEAQERQQRLDTELQGLEARCQDLLARCELQQMNIQDLEARCGECKLNRERLEGAFAELELQVATMEANHEQQQLELLAGIDEREARLGRLQTTLEAQQERLFTLEQQNTDLVDKARTRGQRLLSLNELLADLEDKAHQALDLVRLPSE